MLGTKDLDRPILARELISPVADQRRSSRLPRLVQLFLSPPPVTVPLDAKLLIVALKAVDLVLGGARPQELTDRCRFSAWGHRVKQLQLG